MSDYFYSLEELLFVPVWEHADSRCFSDVLFVEIAEENNQ